MVLKRLAARLVVAAAMVGACLTAASAEKIVISNWDGYMPKDLLDRFKAETGIDAEVTVHATNEEIMGKVIAGGGKGYDVLFVSAPFAEVLKKLDLIVDLDHAKLANLKNLYPEAGELKHDPGMAFSVPYTWGTTGLCYRSDLVEGTPSSWNDLLKPAPALDHKVTMLSTDRWLLAAGFLDLGYSVNETDPEKLEKTKEVLIEAKKHLLAYDDTTFYSKLVSGEALLVQAWDGWCNYGITDNKAIKYVIPKEGSDLWADVIVVTKASENADAAMKFVDFLLRPEVGKWVAENILYKTPNKAAMESLDPALLETYPNLKMTPAELLKFEQLVDVGKAQKDYTKIVTEIVNAQ